MALLFGAFTGVYFDASGGWDFMREEQLATNI
jgi:hypothetical protein